MADLNIRALFLSCGAATQVLEVEVYVGSLPRSSPYIYNILFCHNLLFKYHSRAAPQLRNLLLGVGGN